MNALEWLPSNCKKCTLPAEIAVVKIKVTHLSDKCNAGCRLQARWAETPLKPAVTATRAPRDILTAVNKTKKDKLLDFQSSSEQYRSNDRRGRQS
jgi:hypothetical protein